MASFDRQVRQWDAKARARLRVVARESVQEVISIAQTTVGEGGRMRIDTGFLRASIQAALHTMPSGPTYPKKKAKKGQYKTQAAGDPVSVALLKWDPYTKDQLFVGWTAAYALTREARDAYLSSATELWDQIVARQVKRVRI